MLVLTRTAPVQGLTPGRDVEVLELLGRARKLADELGDPALLWLVDLSSLFVAAFGGIGLDLPQQLALAEDLAVRPAPALRSWLYETTKAAMISTFLSAGRREQAEAATRAVQATAERSKRPYSGLFALVFSAWIQIADGRLEEVMALAGRLQERAAALEAVALVEAQIVVLLPAYVYLGRLDAFAGPSQMRPVLAGISQVLRGEPAGALLDGFLATVAPGAPPLPIIGLAFRAASAALSQNEAAARLLSERLKATPAVTAGVLLFCIPRLLGDCARVVGDREEARRHYENAFEVCDLMCLRPEKALTALGMAELLLDGSEDEQAEAQRHLDFAIAELREMKMQPWLERALKHKGLLKA